MLRFVYIYYNKDHHVTGKKILHDIMTTCIIIHNMIIEEEHDINASAKMQDRHYKQPLKYHK